MEASPSHNRLKAMLAACQKEKADLERLYAIVPAMICLADKEGRVRYLNREWEKTLGFSHQELMAGSVFDFLHPDDHASTKAEIERQLEGGTTLNFENRYRCKDGFNNMLSGIGGYAELALENAGADETLRGDLSEILKAARRSTDITRQLLAFARQQTIAPKVLDLNEAVEGTFRMLRRLISEDIDLVWHPKVGLGPGKDRSRANRPDSGEPLRQRPGRHRRHRPHHHRDGHAAAGKADHGSPLRGAAG